MDVELFTLNVLCFTLQLNLCQFNITATYFYRLIKQNTVRNMLSQRTLVLPQKKTQVTRSWVRMSTSLLMMKWQAKQIHSGLLLGLPSLLYLYMFLASVKINPNKWTCLLGRKKEFHGLFICLSSRFVFQSFSFSCVIPPFAIMFKLHACMWDLISLKRWNSRRQYFTVLFFSLVFFFFTWCRGAVFKINFHLVLL